MSFKTILADLVQSVPGATGAILADWEGEAVDYVAHMDDYDLKIMAAHMGIILNRLKDLHGRLSDDPVSETIITLDGQRVVLAAVGDDYSLLLTLGRGVVPGCAIARFRQVRDILMKEIY